MISCVRIDMFVVDGGECVKSWNIEIIVGGIITKILRNNCQKPEANLLKILEKF